MPNWCNNNIEMTGPVEKLKPIYENALAEGETAGFLNGIVPMPVELNGTEGLGDGPNWYSWRVDNWGTKWEVDTEGLEFEDHGDGTATISGWFDSAWAPPVNCFETYGQANPDVDIQLDYHETGMQFVGRFTSNEGLTEDDCVEYEGPSSKIVEQVGSDYDEYWCISENMAEWEDEEEEIMDDGEPA